MKSTNKNVAVILLAAGGSSRMGTQKLLLDLGGMPVIRRIAAEALASGAVDVVAVTGSQEKAVREQLGDLHVRVVYNADWQEGQASSIRRGIRAAQEVREPDAVIIMTGDQPFVRAGHLNRLMEAWNQKDQKEPIVASSWKETRLGPPVLFDRRVFGQLKILQGDKGAKQIFPFFDVKKVEQEELLFYDVDTPQAFEKAKDIWMRRYGWKDCFPIFEHYQSRPFAYLDSAATAQIPRQVIAAQTEYETYCRANIRRGLYPLAEKSDEAYEAARENIADFFGMDPDGVIFTHGATEALNLAVFGWGRTALQEGDLVILDCGGHHAGIVPWMMLKKEKGIRLEFGGLDEWGGLDEERWKELLEQKPKAVVLTHISNVTGQKRDLERLCRQAHEAGAVVFADCAQSAGHVPLDIRKMAVDFAAASAHKMYGPFGIGFLWAAERVRNMEPLLGGGGMVEAVGTDGFSMTEPPGCFEAGTPNIAGAVGFAAACDFLRGIGMRRVEEHSRYLCRMARQELEQVRGVRILGSPAKERISLLSFTINGVHPHDAASLLADRGVAVRAGHHCAMPFHKAMGLGASIRASFGVYSTEEDIRRLVSGVRQAVEVYGHGTD